MNWLIVVENDLSNKFAMRTHVLELAGALSNFLTVFLVTQTPPSRIPVKFRNSHLYFKPYTFRPTNLAQILSALRFYFTVKQYLCSQRIDVIYQRATAYSLGALIAAKRHKIPTLLEINGAWTDEQKLSKKGLSLPQKVKILPILWLRGKSIDYACRLADHIIVVTPQLKDYLSSRGIVQSKIIVVSNGVNPEHFSPIDKLKARQELGLDPTIFVIGFVGSLAHWQGLDLLIQGFGRLCQEERDMLLMIVGDGSEKRALWNLAKTFCIDNRVLFVGAQAYEKIPQYIASCDLMVAPKRPLLSGYSTLKVFEYMACARPVLASRVQGLEIIEQAEAGLLFKPEDPEDLAQKLRQLVFMENSRREEMGHNGRNLVVNQYTWMKTAQQIVNLSKI